MVRDFNYKEMQAFPEKASQFLDPLKPEDIATALKEASTFRWIAGTMNGNS